jgi:hypothetical protein
VQSVRASSCSRLDPLLVEHKPPFIDFIDLFSEKVRPQSRSLRHFCFLSNTKARKCQYLLGFPFPTALLHKSSNGWSSLFPRVTYPTASVTWMPRAVKPFGNERAKAIGPGEPAHDTPLELCQLTVEVPCHEALAQQFCFAVLRFTQCILVSTRLRR